MNTNQPDKGRVLRTKKWNFFRNFSFNTGGWSELSFHTNRSIVSVFLALIFIYFHFIYPLVIVPDYARDGYTFRFEPLHLIESVLYFMVAVLLLHRKKLDGLAYAVSVLLSLLLLLPNLILYAYMQGTRAIPVTIVYIIFLIGVFTTMTFPKLSLLKKRQLPGWLILAVAFAAMLPFLMKFRLSLNFEVLMLKNIYEVRAANFAQFSSLMGYLSDWLAKVILPLIIVLGIFRKQYWISALGMLALMYMFLVTAQKSVFFSLFVVFGFYFIKGYTRKMSVLLWMVLILLLSTRIISWYSGDLMAESIIARRVFFDPAIGNLYYFSLFKGEPMMFSHSFLSGFVDNPMQGEPARLISEQYFGYEGGNANNGIISDGFMNFGYIGLVFFPAFLAFLIAIFNAFKISSRFFGVFAIMIFTFISSFFFTTLLTHGVLILLLVSLLFLQQTQQEEGVKQTVNPTKITPC